MKKTSDRKYDIVYLYKNAGTEAIRYSLRSLVNVPVDRVFIVGDKPPWATNVTHIPFKFTGSKMLNEWNQMLLACKVTEDFLLFNDDFFILQKLDTFDFYKKDIRRPSSKYFNAYMRTMRLFKSPKNFEVHAPMYFQSEKFQKVAKKYPIRRGLLHRSVYGNHYDISGTMTKDNKIYRFDQIEKKLQRPFASTANKIEKAVEFKRLMLKLFPNKSIYEADNFS